VESIDIAIHSPQNAGSMVLPGVAAGKFAKEAMMKKRTEAAEHIIQGNKLTCPVCARTMFWTRTTLMNTPGMTFFDFDWANKSAKNYVCDNCGHVLWFLEKK
jgi:hypothetical protein